MFSMRFPTKDKLCENGGALGTCGAAELEGRAGGCAVHPLLKEGQVPS